VPAEGKVPHIKKTKIVYTVLAKSRKHGLFFSFYCNKNALHFAIVADLQLLPSAVKRVGEGRWWEGREG